MAVTTKKQFPNAVGTNGQSATVFTPVGIQLNNQDDLDVYVTLSGGTRVLQLRQSTGSTAQSSHPQVNNTDGLYFPAVTAGTTLYNYTLSTDNNTITFSTALPTGATVFVERRTRDADSSYTTFASGSTIRATDLNNSSTESNFTAQDARNKAFTIEGVLFDGDQPNTNFVTSSHIVDGSIVNADINASADIAGSKLANLSVAREKLENDCINGTKIADNAVNSEHYIDGSIDHVHLANDIIDGDNIQDSVINSEHYVAGSIDHVHLANDIIDGDNIQDDVVNSEHIAAGALDNEHYAAGSITSDKLNGATVVTNSEQAASTPNDTSFFTTAAAEARYFNASTGETIKDGQAFPDNDTTIATTAAINDRIIDLVDDVGGFVPIANETSFPTSNPDVNNGSGTLVSIKSISSTRTPSSGTVTIANGAGTGNTVSITGCGSTVLTAGFGIIVETTSTLHTYAFHRLVPKATEVTTVAAKATEIGRLGTAAAVEDMSILGTADVVADMAILGTTDVVNDLNILGTADVVADLNTLGTADVVNDMNILGTSANVTAMSNCSGSISSINNASSNLNSINNFGDTYQVAANNPSTDGGGNALAAGDLYFNTTANELKVYNGSAWQGGVTATGNFAVTTGNTFTGNNIFTAHTTHNDSVKALFGTDSDLEIFHNGSHAVIENTTGNLHIKDDSIKLQASNSNSMLTATGGGSVELFHNNAKKLETTSTGTQISCSSDGDGLKLAGTTGRIDIVGNSNRSGAANTILELDALWNNTSVAFIALGTGDDTTNKDDGRLRFFTKPSGGTIAERLKIEPDGNIQIPVDSSSATIGRLQMGAGQDLQLWHNGTDSFIHHNTGSGALRINTAGGGQVEISKNGPEYMAKFIPDSAVELYFDNSKKFETTSTGITASGTQHIFTSGTAGDCELIIAADSDNNDENDNPRIVFKQDGSLISNSIGINHPNGNDNNDMYIANGGFNGDIGFYTGYNASNQNNYTAAQERLRIRTDGHISIPADDKKFMVGAGNDLQIYHDSSNNNSYIKESGSGTLRIEASEVGILSADGSETMAQFVQNGAASLRYNNNTKLDTKSDGVDITGELECDTLDVDGDSVFDGKVTLNQTVDFNGSGYNFNLNTDGTGRTLFAYYNNTTRQWNNNLGSNGDLEFQRIAGSGNFKIAGCGLELSPASTDALIIPDDKKIVIGNGSDLQLYHNGSNSVINEAGTGNLNFQVTGVTKMGIIADGVQLYEHLYLEDNSRIKIGDGDDLQIYHDGTHSYISDVSGTGNLKVVTNTFAVKNTSDNETMLHCEENGAVSLYHDGTLKLSTSATGINLGTSTSSFITIPHDDDCIKFDENQKAITSNDNSGNFNFKSGSTAQNTHISVGGSESGIAQVTCDTDGVDGRVGLGVGPRRADGQTANYTVALSVDYVSSGLNGLKYRTGSALSPSSLATEYNVIHAGNARDGSWDTSSAAIFKTLGNGGSVALTTNDGGGNANVTFNCAEQVADGDGSSWRIACAVDANNGHFVVSNDKVVTNGGAASHTDRFEITESGTFIGSSSNNISDERLKKNIATISDATNKIKGLKGRTFEWKDEADLESGTQYGFIAQEMESVVSDLVSDGKKWGLRGIDKDGNVIYDKSCPDKQKEIVEYTKGVNVNGVVPILVEALKESIAKIETLETKVAALEAA